MGEVLWPQATEAPILISSVPAKGAICAEANVPWTLMQGIFPSGEVDHNCLEVPCHSHSPPVSRAPRGQPRAEGRLIKSGSPPRPCVPRVVG